MTERRRQGTSSFRANARSQLLALIRLDYEGSLQFVDGVTRISSTIRQTAATAGVTLIGLTIQDKRSALGTAAAVLALLLGLMDAYHGSLYNQTLTALGSAERAFAKRSGHSSDLTMRLWASASVR